MAGNIEPLYFDDEDAEDPPAGSVPYIFEHDNLHYKSRFQQPTTQEAADLNDQDL